MDNLAKSSTNKELGLLRQLGIGLPVSETRHTVLGGPELKDVTLSKDGRYCATAHLTGDACFWEIATGRLIRHFSISQLLAVNSVYISPDNKKLIAACGNMVSIYDLETGKCLQALGSKVQDPVYDALVTGDEKKVVWSSGQGFLYVWNNAEGKYEHNIRTHLMSPYLYQYYHSSLCLSPDGRYLAAGSRYGRLRMWDLNTGECHVDFRISDKEGSLAEKLIFSMDGRKIAILYYNTLKVLDIEKSDCTGRLELDSSYTGEELLEFLKERGFSVPDSINMGMYVKQLRLCREFSLIHGAAFSRDGKYMVVSTGIGPLKVWDLGSGGCVKNFTIPYGVAYRMQFTEDNRRLLACCGSGRVYVLNMATGEVNLSVVENAWTTAVCSYTEDSILVGYDNGQVALWDIPAKRVVWRINNYENVCAIRYDPKRKLIFTATTNGRVKVWDAVGRIELMTFREHDGKVNAMELSPDGKLLYTACDDFSIKVWDIASSHCIRTLMEHTAPVAALSVSEDRLTLASASKDGISKLWDAKSGRCLKTIGSNCSSVQWIYYSSSKWLVTMDLCGIARFHSPSGEELLASFFTLQKGFLWTTPPDEASASGWLWTDRPELVQVAAVNNEGVIQDLFDYDNSRSFEHIKAHNRRDMVLNRLNRYEEYGRDLGDITGKAGLLKDIHSQETRGLLSDGTSAAGQ